MNTTAMDYAHNIGNGVEDVEAIVPAVEERVDEIHEIAESRENSRIEPRMVELIACYEFLHWLTKYRREAWSDVQGEWIDWESLEGAGRATLLKAALKALYLDVRIKFQPEKYASPKVKRLTFAIQAIHDEYNVEEASDAEWEYAEEHAGTF